MDVSPQVESLTNPLIFQQSAAIPYRKNGAGLEIFMVTSRSALRWIVPKGHVETHLTPPDSAALEAYEEAGVLGDIHPNLVGVFEYQKPDGIARVEVFPMEVREVLQDWPEKDRKRAWFPLRRAIEVATPLDLADILRVFGEKFR